jgi:leader peptidase (prepilin peptidase)/N-methyltransferase
MIVLGVALVALLGVPAGMFANLLIDRIPEKQPLRPLPTLASLARPRRNALVIVATAALFAGTVLRFRADWAIPAYLVFFVSLVAVTVIDFQRQIIPNRIVYPTIFASVPLLGLAALAGHQWDRFGHALLGASLAWLALLVIHLISPAGMGFGDVRLAFVLGLFLGWLSLGHVVTGLFLGVLLICAVGLVLAVLRLRTLQDHIAFGPFLAGGSTLAVFAGHAIIRWWVGG